jgi:hypothetical protein
MTVEVFPLGAERRRAIDHGMGGLLGSGTGGRNHPGMGGLDYTGME